MLASVKVSECPLVRLRHCILSLVKSCRSVCAVFQLVDIYIFGFILHLFTSNQATMHADGDWLAVEGALSKDIATLSEYLQTWKLKLSTTKKVSAVFHLNNKEAKHELKVNFNNESLLFCSETKYFGVTLSRSLTYR